MAKRPVDKNICQKCKLGAPEVEILYRKGLPSGLCKTCRYLYDRTLRSKHAVTKDFYREQKTVFSLNYKVLYAANFLAYPILHRIDRTRQGYIVHQKGKAFVNLYGEDHLFRFDMFGLATWLGNQNLIIDTKPIILKTPEGDLVDLSQVGFDLPLKDVIERLVMYDIKLREYAVNQVKKEIQEAKAAVAKFRSKQKTTQLNTP